MNIIFFVAIAVVFIIALIDYFTYGSIFKDIGNNTRVLFVVCCLGAIAILWLENTTGHQIQFSDLFK